MMEIVKTKELDKGYKVVMIQTHESAGIGDFDLYDIDVRDKHDGMVYIASTKCYGRKSAEFWMNNAVKFIQRIQLLVEAREMAYHNQLCYSKTYAMDTPKEGYEDKWNAEKDKANMIEQWLCDMSKYYGDKCDRMHQIRAEWDIREMD